MSEIPEREARLARLAEVIAIHELERFGKLQGDIAVLERRLAALRTEPSGLVAPSPAAQSGADALRRRWREDRIAALNRELAALKVREAELQRAAARALVQREVLKGGS